MPPDNDILFGAAPGRLHGPAYVRRWLYGVMAAYGLLALLYNLVVPIGEGPDEIEHIRYVEYIVRYGEFPPIGTGSSQRPYTIEAKQPATYYLMQAAIMYALGRGGKQLVPEMQTDRAYPTTGVRYQHPPVPADLLPWPYVMRLFGMLCGLGTIALLYAMAREVFPGEGSAPLAVGVASMGLLPQFTFITSVVNNDHLAILVGALVSFMMARTLMRGVTWRRAILLGAALGLAIMSKTNVLIYVPIAVPVVGLAGLTWARGKRDGRLRELAMFAGKRVFVVAAVVGVALVVGGWWIARNFLLYGDALGSRAVNDMAQQVFPRFIFTFNAADPAVFFERMVYTIDTHFGWFGWESLRMPEPFYRVYYVLIGLAMVGLVALLARRGLSGWQKAALMLAVLVFELFYISMIWYGAWRGRLLFPALASSGLLAVAGTYGWMGLMLRGRARRYAPSATAILWGGFLLVSNLVGLFGVIAPRFYRG